MRTILYGGIRHHPGHGGRIAAPQIRDSMLFVAVHQKSNRLSKVEWLVLDLKVDFGAVQRCYYGFGQRTGGRTGNQWINQFSCVRRLEIVGGKGRLIKQTDTR